MEKIAILLSIAFIVYSIFFGKATIVIKGVEVLNTTFKKKLFLFSISGIMVSAIWTICSIF